jgi:putative membrane protein insertion efficiency factor
VRKAVAPELSGRRAGRADKSCFAGKKAMKRLLIALVTFYRRRVSPLSAPKCRFTPTCSAYALEAIEKYGAGKGTYLAVRRFLRCHPFHRGGYDPVP